MKTIILSLFLYRWFNILWISYQLLSCFKVSWEHYVSSRFFNQATVLCNSPRFPLGFLFELVKYKYLMSSSTDFVFFLIEFNQVIALIRVLNTWKKIYFIHEEDSVPFASVDLHQSKAIINLHFFFSSRFLTIYMSPAVISLVVKSPLPGSSMRKSLLMWIYKKYVLFQPQAQSTGIWRMF